MPMSPRIKAKKGRFGAGGVDPTIAVVGPDSAVNAVAEAGFISVANDDVDGDISATTTWTSDLDGLLGTGASVSLTFTTVGTHVVTAEATAATGGATTSSTLTVEVS